jgi:hypothetical protein
MFPLIATATSKEKQNENLHEWISGILGPISNGYPLQHSLCCALKFAAKLGSPK